MLKYYLGDKAFYRRVLALALPILIQNGITTFVSLLDNIMVGQVGPNQMGGVSIVNQLIFVFNLAIFGINSGTGIFTAQFYGSEDHKSVRHTFVYKLIASFLITALFITVLIVADEPLIKMFLQGEGAAQDAAQLLAYGKQYLYIMLIGLLPFAISNAYATTLRECGQTVVPMVAGSAAVFVNLVLNYILIFGHLGFAPMGVQGAAIATMVSRFVELLIVAGWTHLHSDRNPFIQGLFRGFKVPVALAKQITIKSLPLFLNEILWSCSVTFMNQCYTTCALDVVNAVNITSTIVNLSNVVMIALGNTISIMMGQMLGANTSKQQLRQTNRQLIALSVAMGIVFGGLLALLSGVFPKLYNTTQSIRQVSTQMILILALVKPIQSYVFSCYYTFRSGGQALLVFMYDSGFMWLAYVPLAYILSRYTALPFVTLYFLCQLPELPKAVVGYFILKKDNWMQNLTAK